MPPLEILLGLLRCVPVRFQQFSTPLIWLCLQAKRLVWIVRAEGVGMLNTLVGLRLNISKVFVFL